MPTNNPKISAYVPQNVYDAFKHFQEESNLSMSQAVIIILAEYFGIDLSKESSQEIGNSLLSRLLKVEDKMQSFEKLVYDLAYQVENIRSTSELQAKEILSKNNDLYISDQQLNNDNYLSNEIVDQSISTSRLPDIKTENLDETSNSKVKPKVDKSNLQLELLGKPEQKDIDKLEPLNATQLSKRFNKPDGFVKSKKFYYKDRPEEFLIFLAQNDPDRIGWKYSEEDKKYHPVLEN